MPRIPGVFFCPKKLVSPLEPSPGRIASEEIPRVSLEYFFNPQARRCADKKQGPSLYDGPFSLVAGAGFEPATFGL